MIEEIRPNNNTGNYILLENKWFPTKVTRFFFLSYNIPTKNLQEDN